MIDTKIRRRQIEKARRMMLHSHRDTLDTYYKLETAFEKEFHSKPVEFSFVPIANAFISMGEAAREATTLIANLVPNLYI